ncbi:MAG: NAD(+) synthase [Piscinibacter sp.]|nr:NAD(+) synthase [Piscinibacter sp.]
MNRAPAFSDLHRHGFARVAVAVPRCRVADPAFNAEQTLALWREADTRGASLVAFPELGLAAYSSDDLFHQRALLDGCEAALAMLVEASRTLTAVALLGLPVRADHALFNAAVVVQRGRILGVVPKTYLPNYGEFYEARQFVPAGHAIAAQVTLAGQTVPLGADLLFEASDLPHFVFHAEICEDVWVPIPPSSFAALAGATVLVNLSASNIVIGKADYRELLVRSQSARCLAAYLYSSAGAGESTTDLAWDGQALIAENGELLATSERFGDDSHLITADIDLERLVRERMRQNSFAANGAQLAGEVRRFRRLPFALARPAGPAWTLQRNVERFPYVPADPARRHERCREVYDIQVQALTQRLRASGIRRVVVGVSGGLDSTHALLVCAKAMDRLGLPRRAILGVTMPGFATSPRTLDQALRLLEAVGCEARTIDIRPSCEQMLKDLGHPAAQGEAQYDVTYENVQAGERTSHLFRLANHVGGIVVGTGDLSELALGWCTYGVGDHMSHYNVNASVPKTLVQHLVRWVAESEQVSSPCSEVLLDILDTEISPELVPGGAAGAPAQGTEAQIGPYALHDFSLYHVLRFGFAPSKVVFLCEHAWRGAAPGYSRAEIKRHLRTFLHRFFQTSQFKRSCVPNAPKVGSGGSLSPRGDWRAPSDGEAAAWLAELDAVPDD